MNGEDQAILREHADDFFRQVAWKYLKMVDLPYRGSNQHEMGGVGKLRSILGTKKREGVRSRWRIFNEDSELVETVTYNDLTWYDCRVDNPNRSAEWRLYYPHGDPPLRSAREGDLLLYMQPGELLPLHNDFELLFYVVPQESSLHNEVLWSLGLGGASTRMRFQGQQELQRRDVDVLRRDVLLTLEPDLRLSEPSETLRQKIFATFGDFLTAPLQEKFPSTASLATFAHENSSILPQRAPDAALVDLLDVESRAFYVLEEAMLKKRLDQGFEDVDDFISFSLSVQNRRKARRGISLEKHLAHIFDKNELRFEEQVRTERSTVDFMFPGAAAYTSYAEKKSPPVMMLAAKSSCKDRWRQVLNEAQALDRRHLFTLEAAISSNQTSEMGENGLSLVVPEEIVRSFEEPGTELLNLQRFVAHVRNQVG